MQLLLWFVICVVVLLLAGALWEAIMSARTLKKFPPPGTMVDVGGRRLHLFCTGDGQGPTVLIEAGRFNTSVMWSLVQEEVSRFARVCTYDRSGYAWSDPDSESRTGTRVATDLHTLLRKAEVPGPYLLVGHSLGAMYVRYFAEQYPDELAGVILVDPYTEGEVRREPQRMKAMQTRFLRIARFVSRFGIPRLVAPLLRGMTAELQRFPLDVRTRIIALAVNWRLWQAVDEEWRELEGMVRQLGGPRSLGDKPLLILSAGRCDLKAGGGFSQAQVEDLWRLMKKSQAELTHLSSRGRLMMVPDTGHAIPLERPEVVVDAIRELLSDR